MFLYEKLDNYYNDDILENNNIEIIDNNLSDNITLREYQNKAFQYFINYYENPNLNKGSKIHNLFHMATGSGKTVVMAGLILYLFSKGFHKVLFFVDKTNIINKTRKNFIDTNSSKYLFAKEMSYNGSPITIKEVDKFSDTVGENEIEISFMTLGKLHNDLSLLAKENSFTIEDFEKDKILFISDESHHLNSMTKSKLTKDEEEEKKSWEETVLYALHKNKDSVLLEFTATCELSNANIKAKYENLTGTSIIYNYTLKEFRIDKYTKEFYNCAYNSDDLWHRELCAIIINEYKRYLFNDIGLEIKPVLMFKSKLVKDNEENRKNFYEKLETLNNYEISKIGKTYITVLDNALEYFKEKDDTFNLLVNSLKTSFAIEKSIIIDTEHKEEDNLNNLNSMEEAENPYRLIFTVDMLNEGWDILNLFDIVRLYDTRDSRNGKSGKTTISEAQLIGRGARYCPFKIEDIYIDKYDILENEKHKRKFDNNYDCPLRPCETLHYHCFNDSRYIEEIRDALKEQGIEEDKKIELKYWIKDKAKKDPFFKELYVYSNERHFKDKKKITSIDERVKSKTYDYVIPTGEGKEEAMSDQVLDLSSPVIKSDTKNLKIKEIDNNILLGTAKEYKELNFNNIKSKFPNCKSLKDFLTNDNYCGNINIKIKCKDKNNIKGINLYKALKNALNGIVSYINSLSDSEYEGSKNFKYVKLEKVLEDIIQNNKVLHITATNQEDGKGHSQSDLKGPLEFDFENEDWYIFNDNFGTNIEKEFLVFFRDNIKPILDAYNMKYLVVRNERIKGLEIYNFTNGEKFEPDFLIFIKNDMNSKILRNQIYAEPKGGNLIDMDKWKEDFLLKLENEAIANIITLGDTTNIIGLPFFIGQPYKIFENKLKEAIEKINI